MAKSNGYAPKYAYDDNPKSKFVMLYCDMAKSEQMRALTPRLKSFYYDCRIQSGEDKARANLAKHIEERFDNPYANDNTWSDEIKAESAKVKLQEDIKQAFKDGKFTFPTNRLKEYGYNRCQASRLFEGLIATGFVEKVEDNSRRQKENLYKFSAEWKKKSGEDIRVILKELSEKYHPKKQDKDNKPTKRSKKS